MPTRRRDTRTHRADRYQRAPAAICDGPPTSTKKLCTDHPQGAALRASNGAKRANRGQAGLVIRGTGRPGVPLRAPSARCSFAAHRSTPATQL